MRVICARYPKLGLFLFFSDCVYFHILIREGEDASKEAKAKRDDTKMDSNLLDCVKEKTVYGFIVSLFQPVVPRITTRDLA